MAFYLIWIGTVQVFLSLTSDRYVQCSRVGLEVKIYDAPAGGIRASHGTFSSLFSLYVIVVIIKHNKLKQKHCQTKVLDCNFVHLKCGFGGF